MEIVLLTLMIVLIIVVIGLGIAMFILFKKKSTSNSSIKDDSSINMLYQTMGQLQQKIDSLEGQLGAKIENETQKRNTDLISTFDDKLSQKIDGVSNVQKDIGTQVSNTLSTTLKETNLENQNKLLKTFSDNIKDIQTNLQNQLDNNQKAIASIQEQLSKQIDNNIKTVSGIQESMNKQLDAVSNKMEKSINESNEKVQTVLTATTKIEASQKDLQTVSDDLKQLNASLTYTNPMGKYGERILGSILRSIFGDTRGIFEEQKTIKNDVDETKKVIADAVINLPEPYKMLCIDSKFSFEKFKQVIQNKKSPDISRSEFKQALKNEINKIANSYIIPGTTMDYALMFIPNDGTYIFLQTDDEFFNEVVLYAEKKKVIITSPSTIQPILYNLHTFAKKIEDINDIKNILDSVKKLEVKIEKFKDSWNTLEGLIDKIVTARNEVNKKVRGIEIERNKFDDIETDE